MEMESDVEHSNPKKKVESLQALAKGPLASSVAKLSGSSRGIPSGEEFHFSYNFSEFKAPIREISEKSESMLATIGSSSSLWGKSFAFPSADDPDDAYDWLVNINDEIFERFDASLDEFQRLRKKEEEGGGRGLGSMGMMDDGFQLVYGKKKKKGVNSSRGTETEAGRNSGSLPSVTTTSNKKATTMARPRVPFHIPTIPRPQEVFNILVNNSNQPFEHVWLQKSEDESRFIHPLERLSVLDFVDRNVPPEIESVKVLPIESTPFALVEEVKGLKELAAKLQNVDEFAVDLEHNQYRSFQGLTCLMQISTRTEDFVVDTLKLRVHVGPYLRELFKDPSKRKVMHGADRDIVWLQRDFGIYVCNLFDTGQASRVLQLERNSLEYLLNHFCGVTANKEYQNADWRLRPIPDEMIKYAREDTHYLLHIYDLMRGRLLATSAGAGNGDSLLLEVYKRSYDVCMQLYEKEILTDTSYLHIYGLLGADFNSEQLAIVAGLCQWRDAVGRAEDESTGYILPNKALLEIARQKPITASHLRRLVKLKHPYVERNLGSVVSIIRSSIQNASAFESAAEQLKKGRLETALEENVVLVDESEPLSAPEDRRIVENMSSQTEEINVEKGNGVDGHMFQHGAPSVYVKGEPLEQRKGAVELDQCGRTDFLKLSGEAEQIKTEENKSPQELLRESVNDSAVREDMNTNIGDLQSVKVTEATVEVLKKPSRAFGALLGKSALKRKLSLDPKVGMKVEQIKSSVTLPFNSFFGGNEQLKSLSDENLKVTPTPVPKELFPFTAETTNLEDIILLENNMKDQESEDDLPTAVSDDFEHSKNGDTNAAEPPDSGDEPMCLSELSSSFQKCFQSRNNNRQTEISQEHDNGSFGLQLKPFDYTAARKQMKFGEDQEEQAGDDGRRLKDLRKYKWKSSVSSGQVQRDEDRKDLPQQARRRQAFPQTGNRTATFR